MNKTLDETRKTTHASNSELIKEITAKVDRILEQLSLKTTGWGKGLVE